MSPRAPGAGKHGLVSKPSWHLYLHSWRIQEQQLHCAVEGQGLWSARLHVACPVPCPGQQVGSVAFAVGESETPQVKPWSCSKLRRLNCSVVGETSFLPGKEATRSGCEGTSPHQGVSSRTRNPRNCRVGSLGSDGKRGPGLALCVSPSPVVQGHVLFFSYLSSSPAAGARAWRLSWLELAGASHTSFFVVVAGESAEIK